jgi:DNA-binding beta-propeller fold protein YncE
MTRNRSIVWGWTLGIVALAGTLDVAGEQRGTTPPAGRGATAAPTYIADPMWPKPLPNHWILGSVTGVAVDSQDHIWLVHRGLDSLTQRTEAGTATTPPTAELCCAPAPPVLEFDATGALVGHWGGPGQGYDWPVSPGAIAVDAKGNVWITAAGMDAVAGRGGRGAKGGATAAPPRPADAHVLKFSRDGKFLLQIGKPGASEGSSSTTTLSRPAGVDVDTAANEVYIADGLGTHRRVVVFDATTGAYKRHWGAYGTKPDDAAELTAYEPDAPAAKQFRSVSCIAVAKDGQVYVCDRASDRIQVFKKDGAFVKEGVISKTTRGMGSVWDIAFSNDAQQQFLFVPSGMDERVFVVRRDTLEAVGSFGDGGRQPGLFRGVGSVAVDSKGNVYTGESFEGKRLQKFVRK